MKEILKRKEIKIGLIIFGAGCLILIASFILKNRYIKPTQNNNDENNQEIKDTTNNDGDKTNTIDMNTLVNLLSLVPLKISNGEVKSYKVNELTDEEINRALCSYIETSPEKEIVENGEQMKAEKSGELLIRFLGLKNYKINIKAGSGDKRFKLEETTKESIKYYKLSYTNEIISNEDRTYTYRNTNESTFDDENKKYEIKTKVVGFVGSQSPIYVIGEAKVYLKISNNDYILEKVEFQKYEKEQTE